MSRAGSGYESWLDGYLARGDALQGRLSDLVTPLLAGDEPDLGLARQRLRERRSGFEPRFCLLLHPTDLNPDLAEVFADRYGRELIDAAVDQARAIDIGRLMTFVMMLLDDRGTHVLMLEREAEEEPLRDGPLRIATPTPLWEGVFQLVAELSEAFIAVAGISVGLQAELNYLADQGLDGRLLIADGTDLVWRDPSTHGERVWPLAELGEAFAHAAAQPIHRP